MSDGHWYWRNCRSLGFGLRFWLWPMAFGWHVSEDQFGGDRHFYLGPLDLSIHYSIGNASAEHWWGRLGAVSETEVWQPEDRP